MRTSLRSTLVLVLAVALVGLAPPAFGALGRVGLVSVTGATTSSLTLTWPSVARATAYDVYRSSDVRSMSGTVRVKRVSDNRATITGMPAGKTFCFQVRAVRGSEAGSRSRRACKPTIRRPGPAAGSAFSVMTFNACSRVCDGWRRRQAAANATVTARKPDVVAVQEGDRWAAAPDGYRAAIRNQAKILYYKASRLRVVTSGGSRRVGSVQMSAGRWAVWSELVEVTTGKRVLFVSAHTSPASADHARRGAETRRLLARIKAVNTAEVPVVFAGDFNSNKNRGTYDPATGFGSQDTVGRAFARAGYYDGYDLARTLRRPNWNSFHGFSTTPTVSYTWGDHVDHVYVSPRRARVTRWLNAAPVEGRRYATPMASDHSPVLVDLVVG